MDRTNKRTSALVCHALVACFSVTAFSLTQTQESIPIQRVQLTPDRVDGEMDRVKNNSLVRMPREEFEAVVRAAEHATAAERNPPKLVRASYSASLSGDGL